jgi:exodeoxyribonuclease V alpha subunit
MLPLPLSEGSDVSIEGKVRRIVYDSPNGSFRVFEVELDDRSLQTVRQFSNGEPMAKISEKDDVRVIGKPGFHVKFGKHFVCKDVLRRTPTSASGVAKVLSGKAFKGIGPKVAQKLVNEFGDELLSILNRGDPGELISDLIGEKKAKPLIATWLKDQAANMTDAMLADLEIGPETRKKLREKVPDIETVILTNPYKLVKEVDGIGFKKADALAQRAGVFRSDSPQRLAIGLAHALDEAGSDGHTGLTKSQLLDSAAAFLLFDDHTSLQEILAGEIERTDLVISPNGLVQTRRTSMRENRLAKTLVTLARSESPTGYNAMATMRILGQVKDLFSLTEEQYAAVVAGVQEPLSVVTGGPGTGKTTTINAIIDTLKKIALASGIDIRIKLMAPTGKAQDRMTESTGHEASTMHMALGRDREAGGFRHRADNPFDVEVVIADEWSMVDTRMADAFFQAIEPKATRVIIVGDSDQLPSVEAGRVLHDIIQSEICPVTRFTIIHRTGPGSAIALGAARINTGQMPELGEPGQSALVFIEYDNPVEASGRIVKMVSESLIKQGYDPEKIQVLSPGKQSAVGVNSLNEDLQKAINKNPPLRIGASGNNGREVIIQNGQRARLGDRVMCMKTAYGDEVDVFNGDVGIVTDAYPDEKLGAILEVTCSKKVLKLEQKYWINVSLSNAMTIHKSQGSEYDVVVIPLMKQHFKMLKRNLLYTGVTRAKKLCVIVGQRDALRIALSTTDGTSRQTGLLSRIRKHAGLK